MPTNPEEKLFRIPDDKPLAFQSIGMVRGKLLNFNSETRGNLLLVTEQGIFPVQIQKELGHFLRRTKVDPSLEDNAWVVYPKQFKLKQEDGTKLRVMGFTLAGMPKPETVDDSKINRFSIRGVVAYQNAKYECLSIALKRNEKLSGAMLKKMENQPFKVEIKGLLPDKGVGWFWELECELEGGKLVLVDGKKLVEMQIPGLPKKPFSKKPTRNPNKKVLPTIKQGDPVVKKVVAPKPVVEKPKKKFTFEAK
jgi:hypothetical protein